MRFQNGDKVKITGGNFINNIGVINGIYTPTSEYRIYGADFATWIQENNLEKLEESRAAVGVISIEQGKELISSILTIINQNEGSPYEFRNEAICILRDKCRDLGLIYWSGNKNLYKPCFNK